MEPTDREGDDLLSELLKPLRLTGVFDSRWHVRAPWAIEGDAEQSCAVLHFITEGGCWITGADQTPLELHAGDLALFPTGTAHRLSDRPDRRGVALAAVLPEREPGTSGEIRIEGEGPVSRLLCAGLHYDASAATHLYKALPWALVLDGSQVDKEPLLRDTLRLLATTDRPVGPGDRLITLRAFEMALVLALRPLLCELADNPSSLPVLRHPGISKAMVMMATRFAEPWTVESLAREVGMSRSAFTAAFRDLVGEAPARHLTGRRMQEAARLLGETSLPQSAVPERVGYQSAVGFHLAFRKWYGKTPGEYRSGSSSAA
ncbi:AraC family transcriptional regulator [Streptomyces lunaelactis]|uniref:AraC family transcriptional regulator n=1 Tax=Streptomyces lunaelactis TaxID=1535768 RepID=A0A2R4T8D3_9ACTN|nr:AraC family transcriptional regulator [Streptomyces lunaelactis]AVZ75392.1 AraC family transcriptional regulator [Streptomyces lunaelactis]NUK05406.1 AraC family transcriptional regulator [Streptomyces lunaelactis]NUK07744.1 AraC family transcriptional regulator [Streptomyces lunaelactis]NUK15834.1 AraC family transcriptional regulator [Streptomyces lunaelactis]NUK23618.1 AraC family transcriptional regulator [Streptomyces lunaelactis]